MKRHGVQRLGILSVVAGLVVALVLAVMPGRSAADEFAELQMFIEFNSTDEDAGVQVFLDGDGWKELEIRKNGKVILEIEMERGPIKRIGGLTELRFETAEPSPELVFDRFPEGEYHFKARKVGGGTHQGTVELSHSLPPAPCNLDVNGLTLSWAVAGCPAFPIDDNGNEPLASFEVIVENETRGTKMETNVPGDTLEIQVPPHVLVATEVVNLEVLAVGVNGNKTITEVKDFFQIGP